jgi:hypothetical protein
MERGGDSDLLRRRGARIVAEREREEEIGNG